MAVPVATDGSAIVERYRRATEFTAPKLAASTREALVDGYWLSERAFFHIEERESIGGRLVGIPCIADPVEGTTRELMSAEDLAAVISAHARVRVDVESLASADIEMPDANHLAVRMDHSWYRIEWRQRRVVEECRALGSPALYSPNGVYACVVRASGLWLQNLATGAARPLSPEGMEHCTYGRESETCLAAITYRRCPYPVGLWSTDSQWFLTQRIDERWVPDLPLIQYVPGEGQRPVLHRFRYPLPGDPLPVATLVGIHIESGRLVSFESLPDLVKVYSPFTGHAVWFTGTERACFLQFDRHFKTAQLSEIDLRSGSTRCVLSETTSSGYLELNTVIGRAPNVRVLQDSQEVVWYSERDGWGHLYLYDSSTGRLKNRVTSGEYTVRDIVDVDQKGRTVLFLAGGLDPDTDPARRALCSIGLDGHNFRVLVEHEGDLHVPAAQPSWMDQCRRFRPTSASPGISPDWQFAAVKKESLRSGNVAELVRLSTGKGSALAQIRPVSGETLPEEFTALAADGATRLHGVLFFPPNFDCARQYPLVDYIYPGPQIAFKPQSHRSVASGPARSLAALGFVTLMLDTRGAPIGSRSFHQIGYPQLKEPQLSDHVAVARQLCARHAFLDPSRVGIMGYSGGGSAVVKALCDYPDVYSVGVSGCGEHDPSLYTSMWSDKYRGSVTAEASAADRTWKSARNLKGKLLLITGDMDENVPISQTLALVDGLIRANRNFDLVVVPNSGHDVFLENGYAQRRIWDYFVCNLLGEAVPDPDDFVLEFQPHELDRMMKQLLRRH